MTAEFQAMYLTERADKGHADLPVVIRGACKTTAVFLLANLRHPSLHAKKYSEDMDEWQGRVTRGWRFNFKIEGDEYVILSIIPHPK